MDYTGGKYLHYKLHLFENNVQGCSSRTPIILKKKINILKLQSNSGCLQKTLKLKAEKTEFMLTGN